MSAEELMVKSSVHVLLLEPNSLHPASFGSGSIISYLNRFFLLTVSHVTRQEGLAAVIETNYMSKNLQSRVLPLGRLCYFDAFKLDANMQINNFEELLQQPSQPIDITFAEIEEPVNLVQEEIDFRNGLKVEKGAKFFLKVDITTEPNIDESYGFFGYINQEYDGLNLEKRPTLKHLLKFHRTKGYFHKFLSPIIINDKEDYEGCSGAPILDSEGRLVALACKVVTGSKLIYGFSIQKCIKLLDLAIKTEMFKN